MKTNAVKRKLIVAGGFIACVLVIGNFHVINGVRGTRLIERDTFSFSEIFVNEDALGRMPPAIRQQEYPLSSLALMRDYDKTIEAAKKITGQ